MKKENGITLVAMVITIIILLILATVSISLVMNNGILDKAKSAVDKYSEGEITEQIKLAYQEYYMEKFTGTNRTVAEFMQEKLRILLGDNGLIVTENEGMILVTLSNNKLYEYNLTTGKTEKTEVISKSNKKDDSYVGCYADIDKDGTVDGVIFVDLLTGSIRETQQWGNINGKYTLPTDVTAENVNNYYISQESYTWAGIQNPVISPKTTNGKQRFYIMQLNDFSSGTYTSFYWYKNAVGKMNPLITSNDFGKGKENTEKMIEKWNKAGTTEGYSDAPKDNQDIWNHIQNKYNEGWFVPSRAEWSAFGNELGITTSNYWSTYKLNNWYWTSSQWHSLRTWFAHAQDSFISSNEVSAAYSVRLVTTF